MAFPRHPSAHRLLDQIIAARNGQDATINPSRNKLVSGATPQRREYSLRRKADVVQGIDDEIAIGPAAAACLAAPLTA
jgi:hypothetical protein